MICIAYRALLLSGLLLVGARLAAEGIRQVAPTAADAPVMLETGREDFGNFASPQGDESSRLFIFVGRPDEVVYLGLAPEYGDDGQPFVNNTRSQYQFQIRRATGSSNEDPIVHGPFTVDNNTANVNSWDDALFGNYAVTRQVSGELVYVFAPGQVGNYYIEFFEPQGAPDGFSDPEVNIPFYDFTVVHNDQVKDGRVWSRNWAFRTTQVDGTQLPECVWDREFNGILYSYTDDGFVSRINFAGAGMQGLSFNVAFNSSGAGGTGDLLQDRMSIPGENRTGNSAQHQIFLSEPDPEFFVDGTCGEVNPSTTFRCTGDDTFCLDVGVTKPGQVEVVIDFNRNGILDDNSQDVSLLYEFIEPELNACIPWDGLRGDGTHIDFGDTIDLIINYSQGIQHWSVYDLEYMRNGFCVETIRPQCSPGLTSNLLYWDDRDIEEDPGTGAAKDQRQGCDCNTGCRSWDNFVLGSEDRCDNFNDESTSGYGDKSTINTWWFANNSTILRANIPLVRAFISGLDTICTGEAATLTALDAGATPPLSYLWSGPGVGGFTGASIAATQAGTYCVTITDGLGCSSTTCKDLTIVDATALNINYPGLLNACPGDLVTLLPNGDTSEGSFSWEPAAILDDPTSATPSFTFLSPTTLTVTITSPEGCTLTQVINVVSNTVPRPNFGISQGCEGGLEIQFSNTSSEAVSYSWDFGDPNTTADTSTEASPTYIYNQPGTYSVRLTATSADGCTATFTQEVIVEALNLVADFELIYRECTDNGSEVQFINNSQSDYAGDLTYSWSFTNRPGSTLENPVLNFLSSQTITATLTVTTDNGCVATTIQEDIAITVGPSDDQFPETLIACRGVPTTLVPAADPDFTYTWSPTTGIDLSNPAQPIFSPSETTTYTVVVSTGVEACDITETIEVIVPPVIGISVTGDGVVCSPTTTLNATTQQAATIQWLDPDTQEVLASGNSYTVAVSGVDRYQVLATDNSGCQETTTVTVSGGSVDVEVPDSIAVCIGQEVLLDVINLDANDTLTYNWTPAESFAPGTTDEAMPDYLERIGINEVSVEVSSQYGCTTTQTVQVNVISPNVVVTGDGVVCTPTATLNATTEEVTTIQWLNPSTQEVLASGNSYTVAVSGVDRYQVVATDNDGCEGTTTVTVSGGPVDIEVPDTVAVCFGQEILLNVTNLDANDTLSYNWTPAELFAPGTTDDAMPNYLESIGVNEVSVDVTSQFGCMATENVHVAVINPNINLDFTSSIDCNGSIITFTNTSQDAFGYVWDFGDGSPRSFEVNPVHEYATPGDYAVTLSIVYDVDCVTPLRRVITVEEPQIEADFTYDIVQCAPDGATIQFMDASRNSLDNTISWDWTFDPASPSSSTVQNPSVTVSSSGLLDVQLIIGTANNCFDTTAQTLDIQLVELDISLEDTIVVCPDDFTVLNPNGDPAYAYRWTPTSGLSDPTAVSPRARPSQTTTYVATAFNTVGSDTCFVTDSLVLFVPPNINLALNQAPIVTTCGEDVLITATATVPVDVVWTNNSGVIGSGPNITLNPFRRDTITATATDEYGCSEIAQVIIIDNGVDINITPGEEEIDACTGIPSALRVNNLDPADTLTYRWTPANLIDGPTDQESIRVLIPAAGNYNFFVLVENQNGCRDSLEFKVNAQEFQATVPDTIFACHNEPTEINPEGVLTYTYNWSPATGLSDSSAVNPTATLTEDQQYFVTITDPATTCTNVDSLRVLIYPDINLVARGDTVLCDPTPAPLSAMTDVATLIVWTFNGDTIGTGNAIDFIPPAEGPNLITVTATDPETNCVETASVTVTYDPLENVIPESPLRICPGESTAINPEGNPELMYEWAPADEAIDLSNPWNPVVTTRVDRTYSVTVTDDQRGCRIIAEIEIQVEDVVGLEVTPEVSNHCEGVLSLNATTAIPAVINWFLLPDDTPLGTGNDLNFVPPLGTSLVYAVAVSAANCTERDTVTVNNYPIDAAITPDLLFCEPTATTSLSITNNDPAQELTIEWEPTGVVTSPPSGASVVVDPNITNTFTATVTNQFGCGAVFSTIVTVIDLEGDLSISADPIDFLLGESSTITVSGCDDCLYEWFPPPGESVFPDDGPIVETTPFGDGDLVYTVLVSKDGCEQSLSITLDVLNAICDTEHLFFPNAFTPNNDGDNDVLRLRSNFLDDLLEVEWMIYDRWGEEIFRTTDPRGEWDGTFRNEQLAPDVYGYWLRIVCPDEEELIQKGNVTLLR